MISVIVPVYNEEKALSEDKDYFVQLSKVSELIFVDGGSSDNSLKYAAEYGRHVLTSRKNRAVQMNVGAQVAQNNILLFLHADARISFAALEQIELVVSSGTLAGGCFRQVLDEPGLVFKWIAFSGNMRAKYSRIFYGDQGIFVHKDCFWKIGGFPEVNICEDILFTRELRKFGKAEILPNTIHCSARRWVKQGVIKTFFLNMRFTIGVVLGNDLDKLARLYQDIR